MTNRQSTGSCEAPPWSHSLVQLLRWRADRSPQRVLYTFLKDGEEDEVALTYGELDQQARRIGGWLQSVGASGERVLLLYPPGLDFIAAFFGCLYAGAVAVPSYPPRLNRKLERFRAIATDAQATIALTTQTILSRVETSFGHSPELARLAWRATDTLDGDWTGQWQERALDQEAIAFIQYTSGSTSSPKGVIVSHRNLWHNERMIQEAFGQTEHSVIVGWLPLYHDMGLIGNVLQPLSIDARCVLLSPVAFLQRPFRWLQAISRYRATTSGGPNFAYDLCARKISPAERAAIDLSSWNVAFNGSEPVRAETMERFARAFLPCGFRREAFYPCYGLAEATLLVSARSRAAGTQVATVRTGDLQAHLVRETVELEGAQAVVSCGVTASDQIVMIVDPDTLTACLPEHVGEVWLSGPSIAKGYWNHPHETELTFHAYVADTGEGPFLRTGDLGFLREEELFITGRLKDLIIIRGLNHYPQDIEATVAECSPALRSGGTVAFAIDANDAEHLVIIAEVERSHQSESGAIIAAIREAVAEHHELHVSAVSLLKPGDVLRTSSGKIQHQACKAAFLSRTFKPVAEWRAALFSDEGEATRDRQAVELPSATEVENTVAIQGWLASVLAERLGFEESRIDIELPITRYGLDSLSAVELAHSIESQLGVAVPFSDLLRGPSVAQLTSMLQAEARRDGSVALDSFAQRDEKDGSAVYKLSYGQQALWFLHQLVPESPAYNLMGAVRIRSDLNVLALQGAFQSLVERHASLRSSFKRDGAQPVQVIAPGGEAFFRVVDASDWSQSALDERLMLEAHRPFALENDALLRVWVFRRAVQEHIVLLTLHHIIADFWSLAVLVQELGIMYRAKTLRVPDSLSPLQLSYTDFAAWQSEMLAGDEGERLWNFWRQELSGTLPVLNIPVDKPRPRIQSFHGSSCPFNLDSELTSRLFALGEAHGATLYMTLLAVFQLLLHRYTGQEEILVGTPTSGRSRADVSEVIGYFVNTLVMRADCSDDPPFALFLDHVRERVLAAFAHQDYPFALLVERLQPVRTGDRSPLVQAVLVLQKSHLINEQSLARFALGEAHARMSLGELALESVALERRIAIFDLTLMMAEVDGGLEASLQYNTDLFDETTIARMVGHLHTLIESVTAAPEQRLSIIPLMTALERREVLAQWGLLETDRSKPACLHRLFEAQAERTPDAIALTCESEDLSYSDLNRRANLLAHYLKSLGCQPETLVGVCLERSTNLPVAILGVLKAGAAYVPLDPAYPVERLAFMLEDSGVRLLLTQQHLLEGLPRHKAQVIALDADWPTLIAGSEENLVNGVEPAHAAYVIYTSGSTGRPKGSVVCHAQVARLLTAVEDRFNFNQQDVWTLFHSASFDFSVWEMWGALLYGGRLIVVPHWVSRAPEAFYQMLLREQVTVLNQTPSAFQSLMEAEEKSPGALALRLVIFGGEALNLQSLAPWIGRHGDQHPQLVNMYGITETTVHVTYKALSEADVKRGGGLIGRPIPDLQVYVLDRALNPVPSGVAGELFVGGEGLVRGYLNRPNLTAERFLPHPFDTIGGARLYRTGDLGRYLNQGELEYLGRIDHQVKIRGYRIELGEIENVLLEHSAVRQASVIVREDATGDKRLVAYLVLHPMPSSMIGELQAHLRRKLPAYMVPAALIEIEELPLTPSGKLNHDALPQPERTRPDFEVAFIAPSTPLEETLAAIWSEVLKVERVGVHDNFFELGGHSLLATQMISRAEDAFEVKIALRSLFEGPTIANLALHILQSQIEEIQGEDLAQIMAEMETLSELSSGPPVTDAEMN